MTKVLCQPCFDGYHGHHYSNGLARCPHLVLGDSQCSCVENKYVTKLDTTTWLCGPPPAKGQFQRYPSRFFHNLWLNYSRMWGDNTLHMFSGAGAPFGVTTDYREETGADIVAPFNAIPRPNESFDHILADPPYADHWQGQWHGELPKPKHVLKEAVRLVKPGGFIGILHIIIIPAYAELNVERIALHPILTGPNNAIRVFNVFRKKD